MASRERKRTERRKRKDRSLERSKRDARREAISARTEARNQAARESLEPLDSGERPLVVTIGAIISALIALSAVIGYLAGVEVTQFGSDGIEQGTDTAPLISVIAVVVVMGVMSWGMWRARYWAVLGFQALLVILLVAASLGLVQATDWVRAIGTTLLIVAAGALFYFMIKAMARIQMPNRGASH